MFKQNTNNDFFKSFFENKNDPSSVSNQNINIRLGFMKKVYGLLSIQLLTTIVCSLIIMFTPFIRNIFIYNSWLLIVLGLGCVGCVIGLEYKKKEHPTNLMILGAFTLMESVILGVTISLYDAGVVLQAFVLTFAIVIGLVVYTITSKKDFSVWGQSLASFIWVLAVAGFLQMFVRSSFIHLGLSIGGAVLFSLFIIYDTNLIMKRMDAEDYVMGVITLYLDIINLFMKILKILQYFQQEKQRDGERRQKRN